MENFFPSSLIKIILIGVVLSSVTMILIKSIKNLKIIKTSKQIWVLNLLFSLILSVPFISKFYNLSFVDGIWVGIFAFICASAIYETLQNQNVVDYKPSSLSSTVKVPIDNEIIRK